MAEQWRPNNQVTFSRWKDCERCGLPWPERLLKRQRGVLVCPECYDDPCYEDLATERELRDAEERQSAPWEPDGGES